MRFFGNTASSVWLLCSLALAALLGVAASAQKTKEAPRVTPEQAAFFETKIRPVLADNCFACHGETLQQGGLRADSRAALLKGGTSGPAIIPGQPDRSPLVTVLHYDGKIKMPPSGKLKPAEIAALGEWVRRGAPWPEARASGAAGGYKTAQRWWSFVPVKKPALPAVKDTGWAKSPIDRFVLAKLEANGLIPAPPADRRTLIRRVYFDLIGLPPTPDEVAAFVADRSPDAYARVVERLLASPHYGERWARHWLDVARYADSNGLDENKAFAHAWRYRDYVVRALNTDKPYDQFIQEQLAGDLMPTDDEALRNDRITATGFLTLGAKVLAEQDKPKLVMDIVDEQIEVTSKAVMGLTVSCARCHDHKFDPVSTRDYYALAGIFKSTKTMKDLGFVSNWNERELRTKALDARIAAHQATLKPLQAAVQAATDQANTNLLAALRRDADRYLLAGWELSRQPGTVSVAEAPLRAGDAPRQFVEAEKFDPGNAVRDTENYGKGIGVIHTGAAPTFAEWEITVPAAGSYQLELRYAAMETRPVRLVLNGKVARTDAAGQTTGSWNPDTQRWEPQGIFAFKAGSNTLRIERDGPIPHFDKLLVVAMPDADPNVPAPRSRDEIAKAHGLIPAVVQRWAERLRRESEKPVLTEAEMAALLVLPEKPETFYGEDARAALKKATEQLTAAQAQAPPVPVVMAVEEGKVENVRVHVRGDTQNLGDEVPRRFPTALAGDRQTPIDSARSGRLDLARWLTRPEHPLTARVAVNRIWQHHFGDGLVRTPDNWGLRGEKPTHPELLDWLAVTFVAEGWSLKKMHRRILFSATYQMSTVASAKSLRADPENRLLARSNRRRLEAEPFRDALLAVSGRLDRTLGGSLLTTPNNDYVTNDQSVNAAQYGAPRRSLYLPVIRNALFDLFQAFDFGDPTTVNARRASTTVAPQALLVLNSPFVQEQARAFADALLARPNQTDAQRTRQAYLKALGRSPTPEETKRAQRFLARYDAALAAAEKDAGKRRARAWQGLCHVLLASNEFIYVN